MTNGYGPLVSRMELGAKKEKEWQFNPVCMI